MRRIISVLLENESGALSRVAGLFSARGYNIESLTVAPTEDPSLSRMTLVTNGSDVPVEDVESVGAVQRVVTCASADFVVLAHSVDHVDRIRANNLFRTGGSK